MDREETIFQIDPEISAGLTELSKLLGRSPNDLANEAIRRFLSLRLGHGVDDLTSTLADLQTYRKSDPAFERAMSDFVNAEVATKRDPMEGTVVTEAGPTERAILGLLK